MPLADKSCTLSIINRVVEYLKKHAEFEANNSDDEVRAKTHLLGGKPVRICAVEGAVPGGGLRSSPCALHAYAGLSVVGTVGAECPTHSELKQKKTGVVTCAVAAGHQSVRQGLPGAKRRHHLSDHSGSQLPRHQELVRADVQEGCR